MHGAAAASRLSADSETPARSKMAIDRLIARREVHLRAKTLWRMLYDTAARAQEILGVNIEDLDFAGRRCPVKAKGARTRPAAAARCARTTCWRPSTGTPAPPGCCCGCCRGCCRGC